MCENKKKNEKGDEPEPELSRFVVLREAGNAEEAPRLSISPHSQTSSRSTRIDPQRQN